LEYILLKPHFATTTIVVNVGLVNFRRALASKAVTNDIIIALVDAM